MEKKFFLALMLSLATVLALQYFFSNRVNNSQENGLVSTLQQPVVGQPVKVATTQDLFRPLNLNVEFEDKKLEAEILTNIETKRCKATFSNYGAMLVSLEFKEHKGKNGYPLKTIYKKGLLEDKQRQQGCFLLALDENTPFQYQFLYKQDKKINHDNVVEIAYKTETEFWAIRKIYTLYQDVYKIDLTIEFDQKGREKINPLRARIFVCAPYVNEIEGDKIELFTFNEAKSVLDKINLTSVQGLAWYWGTKEVLFGAEDKYFAHSIINDQSRFIQRAYVKKFDDKNVSVVFEGVELKESSDFNLSFYIGPKVLEELAVVDDRLVDLLAFGWLSWLCKLLVKLLSWLYEYLGNYGWAIVIMTVLLRLPFIPLSIFSRRKMEEYQRFQPTIQRIRHKYRHDIKLQNEELMRFHREHNLSTATPLIGCLPLLVQMPILFALYRVLGGYLDLYQAPFLGWIEDLSAKDPYYIIPIIMGLTMIWQQVITPSPDEKQKVMMYFVSIVVTVVFAGFPVGLVLYWTMNNVLTLAEDYFRKYLL